MRWWDSLLIEIEILYDWIQGRLVYHMTGVDPWCGQYPTEFQSFRREREKDL